MRNRGLRDSTYTMENGKLDDRDFIAVLYFGYKKIDLSHNNIYGRLDRASLMHLEQDQDLKELILSYNKINHLTISDIIRVLETNDTLTHLDVSGNSLGSDAASNLLEAILNNPHSAIESLNLARTNIDNIDAKVLRNLLSSESCRLKTLILDNNTLQMSDDDRTTLTPLFQSLAKNSSLRYLSLKQTSIDSNTAHIIAKSLQVNVHLEKLGLLEKDLELGKNSKCNAIESFLKKSPLPLLRRAASGPLVSGIHETQGIRRSWKR